MALSRRETLAVAAVATLAAAAAPAVAAPSKTITSADGVPIAHEAAGRGRGTVIFVHGWCCDRTYWDAQWPVFSRQHRVVRLDLAGHGQSGKARQDYTMAAFGADVAAVANAAGNGPVVLVGHSMGGPVILSAAAALKGRLRGLVGVDTFNMIGAPAPTAEARAEMDKNLAPFRADFKAASAGFVKGQFFSAQSDPALVQRVVGAMSSADPAMAISAVQGMTGMDHTALLAGIAVPIVAINAPGTVTDFAKARAQAATFEEVVFSGTKHFLHMEEPARFNAVLDGVLRRLFA